ncbi:MAG: galactose mutarotase [Treponema sp.]|nr:galactose mutarotase [Treponema sp.]MCL2272958.1 galactose mutarotase [Treponema sp.]
MDIKEKNFGLLSNGKKIKLYTLSAGDIKFSLTNIGAAWTSLYVPSHNGTSDDILLGFSGVDGYLNNIPFLGVTVGRFANRIKGASFTLNGRKYALSANDGENNLHSGPCGFDKLLWKSEAYEENEGVYVRFELERPDGDCGFPGKLKAVVSYGLTKSNEIIANYQAKVDIPCPVSLTNHAYFNLAGQGRGNILSHEVMLYSSHYVDVDKNAIPTGKIVSVDGGYFDFKSRRRIDACFNFFKTGYDHCFVVDGEPGKLRPCAEVKEPVSGRFMKVFTTQPGVQFYTGNYLNINGKNGLKYLKHSGFCLETQHFPDSPNQSGFPSCIVTPAKDYDEKAVFSFDIKN